MNPVLNKQKSLYITYLALLVLSSVLLYFLGKGDAVIYMNSLHRPWLDEAMVFITRAGEFGGFLVV